MNGYDFTYVLYVLPGNTPSDAALREVHWGPNELSADGKIKFQDIRALKKVYGGYPDWFAGVPTLVNVESEKQWMGELCIKKLKQWKKEWNTRPQRTPVGAGIMVPNALLKEQEDQIVLPPDPLKVAMEEAGWTNEPTPKRPADAAVPGPPAVPNPSHNDDSSFSEREAPDLMSQLKLRMDNTQDSEDSFDFPPATRDPFAAVSQMPLGPVEVPTSGILKRDSQKPQYVSHQELENQYQEEGGIRTVKFNVSIPKDPTTPTRPPTRKETTVKDQRGREAST